MIKISKITIQKTLACITLTCVFLTYQNCDTSFDTLEFSSCIPGERLKVSLLNSKKTAKYVNVVSYSGEHNARYNYNYFSYSANPIHGPEPVDGRVNIFFYKDSRGLNLSFYANLDQGEVRAEKHRYYVDMDIEIKGNSLEDQVIISDDEFELKKVSQNSYEGRFAYNSNTDGGVIGPIGVDDKFEIAIKFLNRKGNVITDARFFSASGENFILKREENGDIEPFKIKYDGYSDCDE